MQGLDLLGETALDVVEGEVTGCWVAGLNDVEEMGLGGAVKEGEGGGLGPCVDPIWVEVKGGVGSGYIRAINGVVR